MAKHDYDKTLYRLIGILTKLSNNERPNTKELAQEYNVTVRTIQKDINRLITSYPIAKDSEGRFVFANGYSLRRTYLDADEMIFLSLALEQFNNVDDIDQIKDRIYKKIVAQKFYSPYFIKYERLEDIDVDSPVVSLLERMIQEREIAKIEFTDKTVVMDLYKIAAFEGFWYLLARDRDDDKIKTFKLSKIKKVIPLGNYHNTPNEKISKLLSKVYSAFFEDGTSFEVVLKVYPEVAEFFKAREFISSQKILKELDDGSLHVRFEVTHDEDLDNIIKAWLPYVEILEPKRFRDKLHNELKDYLKKVEA